MSEVKKKYGIAVSTYMKINDRFNYKDRMKIFNTTMRSLLNSNFDGPIIINDDGSDVYDHLKEYENNERITIIKNKNNLGISITKNKGIKALYDLGCDYIFLIDDDVEIIDKDFHLKYINAHEKTNIHHFTPCGFTPSYPAQNLTKNDVSLITCRQFGGYLLFLTRTLVDHVGYFKIMTYKYGHEHVEYTKRIIKFHPHFCDDIYDLFGNVNMVRICLDPTISYSLFQSTEQTGENYKHVLNMSSYVPYNDKPILE